MVFVQVEQFARAYKKIKGDALTSNCSVLLLVAPDVDALCACEMFSTLLKGDFISYKLEPVADMYDIERAKQTMQDDEIKTVFLFNNGATIDVVQEFEALEGQRNEDVNFYVCDSHRPINLANCYDEAKVYVLDDGETFGAIPEQHEMFPSESDDEDDPHDPHAPLSPNKRRRTDTGAEERVAEKYQIMERQRQYYAKTYHGAAASMLMWQLIQQVGKPSNEFLWLATLGITEQLLLEKIETHRYYEFAQELQQDVQRTNPLQGETVEQASEMRITCGDEFRFSLVRHWSLFEAMRHSRYVASRLGTWRKKGKDRLKNLFASMGISLELCRQNFASMNAGAQDSLSSQLQQHGESFGLEDWSFPSFFCQVGFRAQLSASDHVLAISALLSSMEETAEDQDAWRLSFYHALDALKGRNEDMLGKGLRIAKLQHEAVFNQLENVVESKTVRTNKSFRYVVLKDQPFQRFFTNPTTLTMLGHFLLDTFRHDKDRKKKTLPLMLAAYKEHEDTYLVVGLWAERNTGIAYKNEFGDIFQSVSQAHSRSIGIKANGFETSVLEVRADDMKAFIGYVIEAIIDM